MKTSPLHGKKSKTRLNAVWRKVWPEAVHETAGLDPVPRLEDLQQEIADLVNAADLVPEGEQRINVSDVVELIESHDEDLTAEDLVEQQDHAAGEEEPEELTRATTMSALKELLKHGEILEKDGDACRSFRVRTAIKALLSPCEEELRQKRSKARQRNLLHYFFPVNKRARTASPSAPATTSTEFTS